MMLNQVINVTLIFQLGQVCWTHGINERIIENEYFTNFVLNSLKRHATGDWGDIGLEDWQENELSLQHGFRIFSTYLYGNGNGKDGEVIWIITEADRSVTTILFPEEY